MIPIIVLLAVFGLIAVRQIGNLRLRIWQIMLLGALAALATGQISPRRALLAINADVMLFLLGVFIIGQALEESGYLSHLTYRLFSRARTPGSLVLFTVFGMGFFSALLMNDTLAIIGTPVVLGLAAKSGTPPKVLLLSLAFGVTTGSVMSPIGNPQNLLIALNGDIANPFITFLRYLFLPTLLNLLLAFLLLRWFYRKHLHSRPVAHERETVRDARLAQLSRISLLLLVALVVFRIAAVFFGLDIDFRLTYIALIAALPVIFSLPRRPGLLKRLDWHTLLFFAAMFVLMQSVWDSGVVQSAIASAGLDLASTGVIFGASVLLSQFLSNVPLVALYLPVLTQLGSTTGGLMALAAGSTMAGNLTILGAASNVIIIQNAEKRGGVSLSFWEFARAGIPLTAINVAVYWFFLAVIK